MGKLDRMSPHIHSPAMADEVAKKKFAADAFATAEGVNKHKIKVIVARVAQLQRLVDEILIPAMRQKEPGAVEAWTGVQEEIRHIGTELRKVIDAQESNDDVFVLRQEKEGTEH